jgi:hypothetical protein
MNSTPKNPKDDAVRMDPTILLPDQDLLKESENESENTSADADRQAAINNPSEKKD